MNKGKSLALALTVTAAACCGGMGLVWLWRMSNHAGMGGVAVEDRVGVEIIPPRRTLLVVLDGLGLESARRAGLEAALGHSSRCWEMHVETPTMSRPVYAVLSSGLEQARTGVRSNSVSSPAAVQSIWELMRARGLSVSVWSDVTWWQELFPRGFTTVRQPSQGPQPDWTQQQVALVHLTAVDHAGHAHGGDSLEYAQAAQQVTGTTLAMVNALDLTLDVAVVTADHGHWHTGGHGGDEEVVSQVLTCAMGKGVRLGRGALQATAVAPLVALLLGLPFPAHMAATQRDLNAVLDAADPAAFPPGYLKDRALALTRFQQAHQKAALALGPQGSDPQRRWWVVLAVLLMALWAWGSLRAGRAVPIAAAVLMACATPTALALWQGTFSLSVIATRGSFILQVAMLTAGVALLTFGVMHWLNAKQDAWLHAHLLVVALGTGIQISHIFVYGWTPQVPLPQPAFMLMPLVCAVMVPTHAALALALLGWQGCRQRFGP